MKRIARALISVYDKTGVVEFAAGLAALGVEIISTGGTRTLLASKGIAAREVSELTGFPEILDGRVKTIHPLIAAGLLAMRGNTEHMRQAKDHAVPLIDLVCVNLYPFAETLRRPGVRFEDVIENIDIGGPSMIRAAAKNFQDVAVVTSPEDYTPILEGLRSGNGVLSEAALYDLARKAFVRTARYDAQIAQGLARVNLHEDPGAAPLFPPRLFVDLEQVSSLRYGENPHQQAAFYRWGGSDVSGLAAARQLQGKELSYNNLVDLEAAWNLVLEFDRPAAAIIKHTNPCGIAEDDSLRGAYLKAYETDTVSAFGSILAFNRNVDRATAEEVAKLFVEAVAAPDYEPEALAVLTAKKNLRLLAMGSNSRQKPPFETRHVAGGLLAQTPDSLTVAAAEWKTATKRAPSAAELRDLDFAWRVVKHVKSNAIVLASNGRAVGVGAGQMSRVDSTKLSIEKAGAHAKGAVLASDAFFPFRDGVDAAAAAGVTAIVQPGGSVKDEETIAAANEHGIAMLFTGARHFKH